MADARRQKYLITGIVVLICCLIILIVARYQWNRSNQRTAIQKVPADSKDKQKNNEGEISKIEPVIQLDISKFIFTSTDDGNENQDNDREEVGIDLNNESNYQLSRIANQQFEKLISHEKMDERESLKYKELINGRTGIANGISIEQIWCSNNICSIKYQVDGNAEDILEGFSALRFAVPGKDKVYGYQDTDDEKYWKLYFGINGKELPLYEESGYMKGRLLSELVETH